MSVAEGVGSGTDRVVRDLLRRCGQTRDRAERAALLTRLARELDLAAGDIAAQARESSADRSALVASLHGQASMARFVADLERYDRARQADSDYKREVPISAT